MLRILRNTALTGSINNLLRPHHLLTYFCSMPRKVVAAASVEATATGAMADGKEASVVVAASAEVATTKSASPTSKSVLFSCCSARRSSPRKAAGATLGEVSVNAAAAAAVVSADAADLGVTKAASAKKSPAARGKRKAAAAEDTVAVAAAGADAAAAAVAVGAAVQAAEAAAEAAVAAAKPKAKRSKAAPAPPKLMYDQSMRPPAHDGPATKVLSWNVAGLRALLKKDAAALSSLVQREAPDVICLQEHKLQEQHVEAVGAQLGLPGWRQHWTCSRAKLGYSGVVTLTREEPLSVSYGLGLAEHDEEGRVVTVELERFYLVNTYVPNSGEGLKRLDYRVAQQGWDVALAGHIKALQQRKPVVLTGDLNCAHHEIDIHRPKGNERSAGFTIEERTSFGEHLLGSAGLVDSFRRQHPEAAAYTYWTYRANCRAKNMGWRLDYFLVSDSLTDQLHDSYTLADVMGSDHCPIGLVVKH